LVGDCYDFGHCSVVEATVALRGGNIGMSFARGYEVFHVKRTCVLFHVKH